MKKNNILPPTTYQGGKQRIAKIIIDYISPQPTQAFYDLCCGSGSISIELVNRGHDIQKITMLDKSPWGLFWEMIGNDTFNLNKFTSYCNNVPKDKSQIKSYMQKLFNEPVNNDAVYIFLLLQSSTFGGAAVWIEDGHWKKSGGFRNYWTPTAISNRRHPVNPMMPLPNTLLERVKTICHKMKGIKGIYADINEIHPSTGIIYIDPPYNNTAFYGYTFDPIAYTKTINNECYISEGKPLSNTAFLISNGRKKGNMSGKIKSSLHEEWLSVFNK